MRFILTILFLFSICQAQIIADGKTDNTRVIIDAALAGRTVYLPEGVTNCSKSIFTDTFATAKELMNIPVQLRAGFQNAKYRHPLIIKGCAGAVLNFTDTDTNSTAMFLTAQGRGSNCTVTEISDVTIRGKGFGIVAAYLEGLRLDNVKFVGFKQGLVMNNVYGFQFNNLRFDSCGRAAYLLQSHGGLVNNTWLYQCGIGFELSSNHIMFNFYYANYCGIGLIVRAANNEFHCISFESTKTADAQLIIGNDSGQRIDGNIFSTLLIAGNPNSKCGILWKKTAGNTTIVGDFIYYNKSIVDSGSMYKLATTKF
jgi:hypothetical protein